MAIAQKRGERVHSSLSRSELRDLDAVVTLDGSDRSTVLRTALLDYLKRRKGPPLKKRQRKRATG